MSTGSDATLLLKAAPEPDQLAERLEGGPWGGLEVMLRGSDVADDAALDRAIEAVQAASPAAVTAEAPVAWPSGAFVRVDRLDDEARAGIERSARFAAGIGASGICARAARDWPKPSRRTRIFGSRESSRAFSGDATRIAALPSAGCVWPP